MTPLLAQSLRGWELGSPRDIVVKSKLSLWWGSLNLSIKKNYKVLYCHFKEKASEKSLCNRSCQSQYTTLLTDNKIPDFSIM